MTAATSAALYLGQAPRLALRPPKVAKVSETANVSTKADYCDSKATPVATVDWIASA